MEQRAAQPKATELTCIQNSLVSVSLNSTGIHFLSCEVAACILHALKKGGGSVRADCVQQFTDSLGQEI